MVPDVYSVLLDIIKTTLGCLSVNLARLENTMTKQANQPATFVLMENITPSKMAIVKNVPLVTIRTTKTINVTYALQVNIRAKERQRVVCVQKANI